MNLQNRKSALKVIILIIFIIIVMVYGPLGYGIVVGESMEPKLTDKDIVIIDKWTTVNDVEVGDTVTYRSSCEEYDPLNPLNNSRYISHDAINITSNNNIITQGVQNDRPDQNVYGYESDEVCFEEPVTNENLVGVEIVTIELSNWF